MFDDDQILVVNKQSGLLSVPGKPEEHADCIESRAKEHFPEARIVHRLDLDTSGIMVLAMNAEAHRDLSAQFEKRKVQKEYVARIWGHMEEEEGAVDLPLRCDWPNRPMQMVDHEQGKPSQTRWKVIDKDDISTYVRLYPHTGRSHQLRVHMKEIGHPILGDNFYAPGDAYKAAPRLQLHAEKLIIRHPKLDQEFSFTAECDFF